MKKLLMLVLVLAIALFSYMGAYAEEANAWYELSEDKTVFTVRLPANPTTGYEWNFEISDPEVLELATMEYVEDSGSEGLLGAGGTWVVSFIGTSKAGDVDLTLNYKRSWEDQAADARLVKLTASEDRTLSVASAEALAAQPAWYELDESNEVLTVRLPANTAEGYKWDFEISDPEAFELITMEYAENEAGDSTWMASFKSTFTKAGKADLLLNYVRDGEAAPVESRVVKVFIVENSQLELLYAGVVPAEQPAWYELSEDKSILTVRLPANTADGYEWNFEISDPDAFELVTMEYAENGAGEDSTWAASFRSTSARGGSVDLTLTYKRGGSDEVVEARKIKVYLENEKLDVIYAKVI